MGPSASGAQPAVEHAHRVIKPVCVADANERLTSSDGAGASERVKRGDGKLRLCKGQPRLGAESGVPWGSGRVEPPRLLVEREEQQRQRVRERHLRDVSSERPGDEQVAPVESAFELAVRAPLSCHERMFAYALGKSALPAARHGAAQ